MGFYEQFTSLFGKRKDARIEELEAQVMSLGAKIVQRDLEIIEKADKITVLEAELAPFREYVEAHTESPHDSAPPDESSQDETGEEGQEEEVDRPRDEQGRFMSADEADTE